MSGASVIEEDHSWLSRLDRLLFRGETLFNLLGGLAIFSLMLLAVVSVGGRNFFNRPLPGYIDWIEQIMPLIALIGVSYCQRLGGHVRMDLLVGRLRGRSLWLVEALSTLAMLALILLLIWGSWAHFERSFDWQAPGWSRDSSLDIRLPIWPAKLIVPLGFSVLGLRLLLQLCAFGLAFWRGSERPVAVPLVEDAAAQAAREAESVSGFDCEEDPR